MKMKAMYSVALMVAAVILLVTQRACTRVQDG